ncbi:hypothetical protein PPYR_14495 [Photinus pyralis]|uniref:WAP domain-containing protein n=1 Tax=Photinus pyralis TaxID=7054 RepID=A0A1Y1MH25_PHOPY|nr:U-scoloptoxin(19)-Sm1a-like isoform X2 [Photinus pyralis]KAB0792536.1 hypothetical protein PPYR_14495 [Photinus pyralis]
MFSASLLICLLPIIVLGDSGPTDFYPEDLCSAQGGQCIKLDECSVPVDDIYLNLCPEQQAEGAECCHGVSTKEYRCKRFGGDCVADGRPCPDHLQKPQATDCLKGTFCCIFI